MCFSYGSTWMSLAPTLTASASRVFTSLTTGAFWLPSWRPSSSSSSSSTISMSSSRPCMMAARESAES